MNVRGSKESMRHIAAPAAGDAHLGEELRGALEERNITLPICLRASDRGEESGRAAAGDDDLFTSHSGLYRTTSVCSHGTLPARECFRSRRATRIPRPDRAGRLQHSVMRFARPTHGRGILIFAEVRDHVHRAGYWFSYRCTPA